MGTPRGGSVRIQHRPPRHPSGNAVVPAAAAEASAASVHAPRFPKLDECAHFHYDVVDLGPLAVTTMWREEEIWREPIVIIAVFSSSSTDPVVRRERQGGEFIRQWRRSGAHASSGPLGPADHELRQIVDHPALVRALPPPGRAAPSLHLRPQVLSAPPTAGDEPN